MADRLMCILKFIRLRTAAVIKDLQHRLMAVMLEECMPADNTLVGTTLAGTTQVMLMPMAVTVKDIMAAAMTHTAVRTPDTLL